MEKRIVDKIKDLQGQATSQEEFMKQLAGIDENGQLTEEFQAAVNGGGTIKSPLIGVPTAGMWNPIDPPTFPDTFDQTV